MRKKIILGLLLFIALGLFISKSQSAWAATCYRACPGYGPGYPCSVLPNCSYLSGCGGDGFCYSAPTCVQSYTCSTGGSSGTTRSGGTPGTTRRRTTSPPPINGVCSTNKYTCSSGYVSGARSNSGYYIWDCIGSNGGTSDYYCESKIMPACNNSIINGCFNGVVENLPLSHAPSHDNMYNYWHCWNPLNREHVIGCRKKIMPACNNNRVNACFNGVAINESESSGYNNWHCFNSYGDQDPSNDENITGCFKEKTPACDNSIVNGCINGVATDPSDDSNLYYWHCYNSYIPKTVTGCRYPKSATTTTTTIPVTSTISVNVFVDLSSDPQTTGNGVQDTGEVGYADGATVLLSPGESVITNSSGGANFPDLASGTYNVALTVPAGYIDTTSNPASRAVPPNTTVNFGILPFDRVTGYVFVDSDKDGIKDTGEDCYDGFIPSINMVSNDSGIEESTGNYISDSLCSNTYKVSMPSTIIGGCHTVSMTAPSGYFVAGWFGSDNTGNKKGTNNAASVCGSVVNFGISNSVSWIQVPGGDWRGNGITNTVPPGPGDCQLVSSPDGSGGSPGILFTGSTDAKITSGKISSTSWLVGGYSYPEVFNTRLRSKTSYSYMRSRMLEGDLTSNLIPLGSDIASIIDLEGSGIYYGGDYRDLSIDSDLNIDGNKDIVVLVNGNLNINAKINVDKGSTLTFSVAGDIIVNANVGEADISSTIPNLEGYFSADDNFVVEGASNCGAAAADKRLNIEGSVVAGAGGTGGSFINRRDLCLGNLTCPAFYVAERPDFVLNAPAFLRYVNYKWREVAP